MMKLTAEKKRIFTIPIVSGIIVIAVLILLFSIPSYYYVVYLKDTDDDGVPDRSDAFPNNQNETKDSDGDGWGDNEDAFPDDSGEWLDSDGDGVGDNTDAFPNNEDKITVNLASPNVQKFNRAATPATVTNYVWDATLNINNMTPKDEKVLWSELKLIIKGSTGSVLMVPTALTLNDPVGDPYDTDDTPANIGVEFWYVETGANTQMNAGDVIKITGMTTVYEGATLELTKAGERIGSTTLPTNFP